MSPRHPPSQGVPESDHAPVAEREQLRAQQQLGEMKAERDRLRAELRDALDKVEHWRTLAEYREQMLSEQRNAADRRREPQSSEHRSGTDRRS